jgi:hypothetical protein
MRDYLAANALVSSAAPGPAEPTTPPRLVHTPHGISQHKALPPPAAALQLVAEQFNAYELTYGGLPTFVYTAQAPVAPASAPTATLTAYIVLVAQRLPSGELQTALASVTDSGHLNRQPWMRFIDVVDPDGSHRGSLLFELRAAHGRQFAFYSLATGTAEQSFATSILE